MVNNELLLSEYLKIEDMAAYLSIRRKTLYAMVESGDIPHYRIGRLIRFRKEDVDCWMEKKRVAENGPLKKSQLILRSTNKPCRHVNKVIRKIIDGVKGEGYTPLHGKSDRTKGLGKEADNESL